MEKIWYEEDLKNFPPRTKVRTEKGVFTVAKVISESKEWASYHGSFNASLLYNFGNIEILEKIKRIYREGKIHPYDCEFATGRSCTCWCGERYHGHSGVGAEIK